MASICTICHESLTERPPILPANQEVHMVAMECGHLFHYACIQQWFQTSAERTVGPSIRRRHVLDGSCPCCKALVSLSDSIKIFPTANEEAQDAEEQRKNLSAARVENERLIGELDEVDEEVRNVTEQLEEEIAAHDALRVKYAESLSKIERLQEEILENDTLLMAVRNSFRSELEKIENEKNNALDDIARHFNSLRI